MKEINEQYIELIIRSLDDIGRSELKTSLRELWSDEISAAFEHRKNRKENTKPLDDSTRLDLRSEWAGIACYVCREETCYEGKEIHLIEVEHIIERALGGQNCDSNLVPCCRGCNRTLGQVFNIGVLRTHKKKWGGMPESMWKRLIGDWVVFKQLLYCDRDLAFWLFDSFHRQFLKERYKHEEIVEDSLSKSECGLFGLIARKKTGERLETAFQDLELRIEERRLEIAVGEFESVHGPPPRVLDMSAFARRYRMMKRNHLSGVSA